jgi:hypothetical protein
VRHPLSAPHRRWINNCEENSPEPVKVLPGLCGSDFLPRGGGDLGESIRPRRHGLRSFVGWAGALTY